MCDLFFLSASKWLFPLSPPVLFCIVSQPGFSPEIRDWFYTFFQLPYTFFKFLSLIFVVRAWPAFSYPLQALWCRKGNHLRKQLCSKTSMKQKNSSKYLRTENQAANLITRSKIIIIIITIIFFLNEPIIFLLGLQRATDLKDDGRANLFSHFLSLLFERNSVFSDLVVCRVMLQDILKIFLTSSKTFLIS